MNPNYKRPFTKFMKKASKPLQLTIEDQAERICDDPSVGEAKKGDLSGISVYKFSFQKQIYLIAYRAPTEGASPEFLDIDFYQVGTHENFYTQLKRYLKQV